MSEVEIDIRAKMHHKWMHSLVFLLLLIQISLCCYKKQYTFVNDPTELVPEGLPTRMLGWEQMILMFSMNPPSEVSKVMIILKDKF